MSQNSPAKHERIERHLMRQRGAGARTVQADFGFSFAGLSAPTSQEATPSTVPIEPPAKRRKTVVEDVEREPDLGKLDALDRRGRTKAARTKRRFVVDAEDESTSGKAEDGDDSFVAGVSVKKRKASRDAEAVEPVQAAQVAASGLVAGPKPVSTAQGASRKQKRKQAKSDVSSKNDVDIFPEEPELAAKEMRKPKVKERAARNAKRAVDQDADTAPGQHAEQKDPAMAAEPEYKPKKRVPRRTAKDNFPQREESALEQQAVEGESVTIGQKQRGPRTTAKETGLEHEDPHPEQQPDPPNTKRRVSKVTNQVNDRPKTETRHRGFELPGSFVEANGSKISPGAEDAAQPIEPTTMGVPKPTRQRKARQGQNQKPSTSVLREDEEAADVESPPTIKLRTAAKSKAVKKAVLDYTPPQLERRALQEADANRSPSPRKSLEEGSREIDNPKVNRLLSPRKSPEKPSYVLDDIKAARSKRPNRSRKETANDGTAAGTNQRKSRKLRIRRAEGQDKEEIIEAEVQARTASDLGIDVATAEEQHSSKEQKKPRKTAKPKKTKHSSPSRHSALHPPVVSNELPDEEEDIDWLFAAPQTRPKAAPPMAPPAKKPVVPRKTKLADIDLDDLIANVAAFAQSGAVGTQAMSTLDGRVRNVRKK